MGVRGSLGDSQGAELVGDCIVGLFCIVPFDAVGVVAAADLCLGAGGRDCHRLVFGKSLYGNSVCLCQRGSVVDLAGTARRDGQRCRIHSQLTLLSCDRGEEGGDILTFRIFDRISVGDLIVRRAHICLGSGCLSIYRKSIRQIVRCYRAVGQGFPVIGLAVGGGFEGDRGIVFGNLQGAELFLLDLVIRFFGLGPVDLVGVFTFADIGLASRGSDGVLFTGHKSGNLCFFVCQRCAVIFFLCASGGNTQRRGSDLKESELILDLKVVQNRLIIPFLYLEFIFIFAFADVCLASGHNNVNSVVKRGDSLRSVSNCRHREIVFICQRTSIINLFTIAGNDFDPERIDSKLSGSCVAQNI